jgi:hypothetical protein
MDSTIVLRSNFGIVSLGNTDKPSLFVWYCMAEKDSSGADR